VETIRTLLVAARTRLSPVSDSAASDAQLLLCNVLDVDRAFLFTHPEHMLTTDQIAAYDALITRCAAGEPLPFVRGRQAWYDREFVVSPAVLIPRPETEQLLEQALAWSASRPTGQAIDVGTGSGILAVTFAAHRPAWGVIALDTSPAALAVARANAAHYGVRERIAFYESDLLSVVLGSGFWVRSSQFIVHSSQFSNKTSPNTQHPIPNTQYLTPNTQNPEPRTENSLLVTRYSLLLMANLPYIPTADLPDLRVSQHEPMLALDGGADGLVLIRRLLEQVAEMWAKWKGRADDGIWIHKDGRAIARPYSASTHLTEMLVLLEIEARQGQAVAEMAAATFPAATVVVLQDLAGHDRIVRIEVSAP
jgi:release factor glutamine methyltransferase